MFVPHGGGANFVPFNTADNWLHLVLGVVMIVLGAVATRARLQHRLDTR
ncbi:DUF4383 domain-containing protein [Nonomuraea sp. NPDC049504]